MPKKIDIDVRDYPIDREKKYMLFPGRLAFDLKSTLGLYPIISRYTGIDLPEGCGTYLDGLTVEDVENAIMNMPNDDELLRQVGIMQSDALVRYSRETFRKTMTGYLKEWLGQVVYGNAFDESVLQIWARMQTVRDNFGVGRYPELCKTCWRMK